MEKFGGRAQNKKSILITTLGIFLISGCATTPYPYYDSAMNDHNRAPSSIGVPTDENEKSEVSEKINRQAKVDYLFIAAEMSSHEGQNVDAISKLEEAYELDRTSNVILYKLAMENYRAGKNKEALKWAELGLSQQPKQKEINILAASLYSSEKQYHKAEVIYKKLISMDKKDPDAYLYLAAIYSEQKRYAEAIGYFNKLIGFKDYEQKHLAYYYGARTKFEADRVKYFKDIKSDLLSSLKHKPDYLEALQFYGQLIEKTEGKKKLFAFYSNYQKKHGPLVRLAEVLSQYFLEIADYDKAYEQLEIIESTTQDPIQVKLKMALILIDKKMYEQALTRLEELTVLVPESDKVKFYLASLYQETKKNELAIKTYLEIQKSSKHYEDSVKNTAVLYRELNQKDNALVVLKKLVSEKPENMQNYIVYAQFLEDSRKYEDGIATLKKAADLFPKEAQLQYFIGTLYDKQNDKPTMLKHMYSAVELDGNYAAALNYIAYSLMEMNQDLNKAKEYALKAYSLDKNDPYITDTVGWIYFQQADYIKAVEFLERAHKAVPEVSVIADHLGDAYVKLNKFEKAYEVYKKAIDNETDPNKLKEISFKISKIGLPKDRLPASLEPALVDRLKAEPAFDAGRDESK